MHKKSSTLKESILKIIDTSTAHGIPNIFRTERVISKIIWLILTTCSIIVGFFFTSRSVLSYLDFEIVTTIKNFYEQPQPFPAVTICSLSRGFNLFNLNSTLIECSFNDDDNCLKNPDYYFETYYDPYYYKCYRFNSGKNSNRTIFKNRLPGKDYGLKLILNETIGLIVNIHNQSLLPFKNEASNNYNVNNILVSSGYITDIIVNRIFETKLPHPYNECYEDLALFSGNHTIIDFIKTSDQFYSQQGCLKLCFNLNYINENPCNCSLSLKSLDLVWEKCFRDKENRNITGCTSMYKKTFVKNSILEKCQQYCPLECETLSYSVSYSIAPIITPIIYNQTSLYIFYRQSQYTLISQQAKTELFELISNAGGILGLFIGISFLSFIEIVEILIEIIYFFKRS